ncbi:hypothetical protein B5C26_21075 [Photorhabdus luminescens]|uniref:Uncharacterized protein n=2 Tax=Photorhabdus TaxID=29487 RepID=A0A4R4JQA0_PHOLU|nr:hypothetical protein [Photorhabdus hainanensis]OCA56705.1 hypothetical protein Phpb_00088 [Photorhabdus namnaonensis]OWO79410.1 hypothetical protein B5C26_21075 [Photorhabdus luminescens]TDB56202.1 hypothetical protein C5468_00445 [Photorhabdus luminescens subsp. mexicana]
MEQLFSFALVPIGTCCCIDDYGALRSAYNPASNSPAYRQKRSLPSNCRLSSVITRIEVMGGFAHVA